MKRLHDDLTADLSAILNDWRGITAEEPWISLPPGHHLNHLPEVLGALLDAALGDGSADAKQQRLIAAGVEHGSARRHDDVPQDLLFREFYLLRQALWRRVRGAPVSSALQARAIMQVDVAITLAMRAALYGYNRPELDAQGRWTEALAALEEQSPLDELRLTLGDGERGGAPPAP